MRTRHPTLALPACATALCLAAAPVLAEDACQARSGMQRLTVVELYTSEGCNSCPPADRWLSGLKARPGVLALAFHVDYWDRLGWVDRFASAAYTERQYEQSRIGGGTFVYTPQVRVDGADYRRWAAGLPAGGGVAAVQIGLRREGARVLAEVSAAAGAPPHLAGYWAVLEDGHESQVRAGENAGATLHHDRVVRRYQAVPAWPAAQPPALALELAPADPAHPRSVAFVVTDAANGRPLQALALPAGC